MSSVGAFCLVKQENGNHPQDASAGQLHDAKERMAAVNTVLDCNSPSDPTIKSILALLRSLMTVDATCISFVKEECVHIKQSCGSLTEGSDYAAPGFCFWTLVPEQPQVLIVEDTLLDARTSGSPLVTGPAQLRFYAAAPLVTGNQQRIGTLCLVDQQPHRLTTAQAAVLANFAELVMRVLEAGVLQQQPGSPILGGAHERGKRAYQQAYAVVDTSAPSWEIRHANPAFYRLAGKSADAQRSADFFWELFAVPDHEKTPQELATAYSDDLTSRQPFVVRNLAPGAQASPLYALLRPATASRFDADSLVVGIPARAAHSSSNENDESSSSSLDSLYFVLLMVERSPAKKKKVIPFKNLRLGSALGTGASAKVYRGTRNGESVAVKIIHDLQGSFDKAGRPMEALFMEAANHPNILRLMDCSTTEGDGPGKKLLWLLIEYCDGGSLIDAIDKGLFRKVPSPDAAPCIETILLTAREVASGLAHLHACGIVHCDISGGNVLLQSSRSNKHGFTVKIIDLGLGRWSDSKSPHDPTRGTASYFAPEVMRGGPPSKASDVYSFGVILYELISGKRAWGGLNNFQLMYAVGHNGEVLRVPEDTGTSAGLRKIANMCLDHNPSCRQTFDQITKLLDAELSLC